MGFKIAALLFNVAGIAIAIAGGPLYSSFAGILLLVAFILIFFI